MDQLMTDEHRRSLQQLQERHSVQLKVLEDEKKRLKDEMQKTLDIERDKVKAQQRLEMEQKEMQYQRGLDHQKRAHDDSTEALRKQIEQQL